LLKRDEDSNRAKAKRALLQSATSTYFRSTLFLKSSSRSGNDSSHNSRNSVAVVVAVVVIVVVIVVAVYE
jgi:hypothetical protein